MDERKLFHGTPSLQAARGICANSMDFRRSGQNVGALFGKGSYFSAHALYSHNYTRSPDRYVFLAKVLVGKFTQGKESYAAPPPREKLKLYDSCVDNEASPTIFVIFDLAQSYPEYLVQYEDAEMPSPGLAPGVAAGGSGPPRGGGSFPATPVSPDAPKPIPAPRSSVRPAPRATSPDVETVGAQFAAAAIGSSAEKCAAAAELRQSLQGLAFTNPYAPAGGAGGSNPTPLPYPGQAGGSNPTPLSYPGQAGGSNPAALPYPGQAGGSNPIPLSYPGQAGEGLNPARPQPRLQARASSERKLPTGKKADSDKCLIS